MSQTIQTLLRHLCGASDPGGSDADLLGRFVARRDAAAFAAMVARHGPMVLGVCRRLLGDAHDAEDAFQATFLVLARKAGSLGTGDPVGAWLYGVACRVAAHARADRARRRAHEGRATVMPSADTTPAVLWDDLRPVLDEEVGRLPDKYRAPVVLCYLGGKTYDEAAQELGCPKGTVATRLTKARELLRERLSGRGVALSAGALTGLLAEHSRAAVPATLLTAAVDVATSAAAPAAVVILAEGALKSMAVTTLKAVTALIAAAVLLLAGTGVIAYCAAGADPAPAASRAVVPEGPAPASELADDQPAPPGGWLRVLAEKGAFLFRPDGTGRTELRKAVMPDGRLSPDGKSVLEIRVTPERTEVCVADADGKNLRQLSPEGMRAEAPCWSPDGKTVAFLGERNGLMQVHVIDRDGRNRFQLTDGPHGIAAPKFSPDGRLAYLLLGKREGKRQPADLVVDDPEKGPPAERKDVPLSVVKGAVITDYAWSPDGKVIAYGKPETLVFHETATGKEQQVAFADIDKRLANFGALRICWSPDSRAVACQMIFWGGRQANGPKMFGDEEVFVIPRAGKPSWIVVGSEPRSIEWLRDKPEGGR